MIVPSQNKNIANTVAVLSETNGGTKRTFFRAKPDIIPLFQERVLPYLLSVLFPFTVKRIIKNNAKRPKIT